jgi:hypothetical protein
LKRRSLHPRARRVPRRRRASASRHLYACRLQQVGYSGRRIFCRRARGRPRLFGRLRGSVLLDGERAGISPSLKLSTDRSTKPSGPSSRASRRIRCLPRLDPRPNLGPDPRTLGFNRSSDFAPRASRLAPRTSTSVTLSHP